MPADRIVLSAALARAAGRGGHAWVVLQYLLGFQRLGLDVTFVDRVESATAGSGPRYVANTMRAFGIDDFAVLDESGQSLCGLERRRLSQQIRESVLLLNVMGYLEDDELLAQASHRVFLDIDPGYPQIWQELGLADLLSGHDAFATIGLNIGEPDCEIPTCDVDWIAMRQPVVLDEWPEVDGGRSFRTVATWRGPYGVTEYEGRQYGSKVHEFRKLLTLPAVTGSRFELALDIHPDEATDLDELRSAGWRLLDPRAAAGDPESYRDFIQASAAEFSVAQPLYVQTHSGWFSDRSICYLASGKPVVTQDTGFGSTLPTGEGLFAYATLDEAVEAVAEIERDPLRHRAAARELAEAYFDSDRVLDGLLAQVAVA